jgi:hypothetical protein
LPAALIAKVSELSGLPVLVICLPWALMNKIPVKRKAGIRQNLKRWLSITSVFEVQIII